MITWVGSRLKSLRRLKADDNTLAVLLDPLLERLKSQEKEVRLMRVHRMEDGEHCDMFWHADAPELVFHMILGAFSLCLILYTLSAKSRQFFSRQTEDIEKTRQRYPQELLVHDVDQ